MSPFLTPAEAAEFLRFPTAEAFLAWAKRHHVPRITCGRIVRFERDVVLAAFTRSIDGGPARMPRMPGTWSPLTRQAVRMTPPATERS